jgi:methylphosphotriester-DNA--protein-cysteine methyltransferase
MIKHTEMSNTRLLQQIKQKKICFGGNSKLKIYGTLHCKSRKRMHKQNRVFFVSANEALKHGYRPCGYCMKKEYQQWIYLQPAK